MKIRNGFVSNSSSSSFILGCSSAPLDRVQTLELLRTNPDARLLIIGADLGEGDDIFFLSEKMSRFILDHEERFLKSFSNWKAYVDPFRYESAERGFWDDDDSKYDLKENEQTVWLSYSSESEDDFSFFVAHYFLSSDEYSEYWDYYWGDNENVPHMRLIAYTDKTEDPNAPEDWTDVCIGINEFAADEGVGMFSIKKLTEGDLKRLRSGKLSLKEGVCLYRNFKSACLNDKPVHFESGDYSIKVMNSVFDRVRSLKYFLKENLDED